MGEQVQKGHEWMSGAEFLAELVAKCAVAGSYASWNTSTISVPLINLWVSITYGYANECLSTVQAFTWGEPIVMEVAKAHLFASKRKAVWLWGLMLYPMEGRATILWKETWTIAGDSSSVFKESQRNIWKGKQRQIYSDCQSKLSFWTAKLLCTRQVLRESNIYNLLKNLHITA